MSLLIRLWLSVILTMLLASGINFVISARIAQEYLRDQLALEARDSADSLAISIAQQGRGLALSERLVSALFASGRYESVQYRDARGNVLFARHVVPSIPDVPEWFVALIPLPAQVGSARVSEVAAQEGTVTLQVSPHAAYPILWQQIVRLALGQLLVCLLLGVLLTLLLRRIRIPLDAIVNQAAAIAQRRFIRLPVLAMPEFRVVGEALNAMLDQIQSLYAEQAARIDALREEANHDSMTALPNRNLFVAQLKGALQEEHRAAQGGVLVLRMLDLSGMNRRLGRERADALVSAVAGLIRQIAQQRRDVFVGRISGADFAVLYEACDKEELRALGDRLLEELDKLDNKGLSDRAHAFVLGVSSYRKGENSAAVLLRADNALMQAEMLGPMMVCSFEHTDQLLLWSAQDWELELNHALANRAFEICTYPSLFCGGSLLHQEVMLRLQSRGGEIIEAGQFLPYAIRQGCTAEIDLLALDLALDFARTRHCDVAINLSPRSLGQKGFLDKFTQRLVSAKSPTRRLWVEVSERGLDLSCDLEVLQGLAELLERYDAHLGIEHFGAHFSIWPQLYSLKLHYLKLDGSFVSGIDLHPGNQRFVKALVDMTHSLGIDVIAERVTTREEWRALAGLGVCGVTGPAVTASFGSFAPSKAGI